MDFNDFLTIYPTFQSKSTFSMVKVSLSGNTVYLQSLSIEGSHHSTIIELFYFDDNFRRIAQWFLAYNVCRGVNCFSGGWWHGSSVVGGPLKGHET